MTMMYGIDVGETEEQKLQIDILKLICKDWANKSKRVSEF